MKENAILILFYICSMLLTMTSCTNNQSFTFQSDYINAALVQSIEIDVIDREINVVVSNDNNIYIDYYISEKEKYDINLSNQKLVIKTDYNKKWFDFLGFKSAKEFRKINLKIPNYLLPSLSIKTTNENILMNCYTIFNYVSLNNNGGNIFFKI